MYICTHYSCLSGDLCRFAGKLSRLEAERILAGMRDGTYLIRESDSPCSSYTYAIAIM